MNKIPDKIIKLYKGKIEIEFYEKGHKYLLVHKNGERERIKYSVTRATSVIDKSRPLMLWAVRLSLDYLRNKWLADVEIPVITEEDFEEASKQHMIVKEEEANLGKQAHQWVSDYIKAKLSRKPKPAIPEDNERLLNAITAFLKWEKEHKVKFLASEMIVYSKKHNYVGIMDAKAKIDGKITCVDFKTSNGIYDEMRFQVAAYRQADTEESKDKYQSSCIIRFGKDDGEFEACELLDHKKDFEAFLNCLNLRRRTDELKEWGNTRGKG